MFGLILKVCCLSEAFAILSPLSCGRSLFWRKHMMSRVITCAYRAILSCLSFNWATKKGSSPRQENSYPFFVCSHTLHKLRDVEWTMDSSGLSCSLLLQLTKQGVQIPLVYHRWNKRHAVRAHIGGHFPVELSELVGRVNQFANGTVWDQIFACTIPTGVARLLTILKYNGDIEVLSLVRGLNRPNQQLGKAVQEDLIRIIFIFSKTTVT